MIMRVETKKPGRNDPCHCGTELKYKKCCMEKDKDIEREALERVEQEKLEQMVLGKKAVDKETAKKHVAHHIEQFKAQVKDDIRYMEFTKRCVEKLFGKSDDRSLITEEFDNSIADRQQDTRKIDFLAEFRLAELFEAKFGDAEKAV